MCYLILMEMHMQEAQYVRGLIVYIIFIDKQFQQVKK